MNSKEFTDLVVWCRSESRCNKQRVLAKMIKKYYNKDDKLHRIALMMGTL